MNRDDALTLLAQLLYRIAPEIDLDEVDFDAPLQDAMDFDAMDFLNLVAALHEETNIDVPEQDYPLVSSLGGLADYVANASREFSPA